jgi:serine/threonine protein phosphatase PrpC
VASDGLWDVADFDRVAAVAAGADREHGGSVVAVAGAVVAAAKAAGTRDDVTALVVRLWPEGEWEGRDPGDPGGRGGSFEQQRLGPGGW